MNVVPIMEQFARIMERCGGSFINGTYVFDPCNPVPNDKPTTAESVTLWTTVGILVCMVCYCPIIIAACAAVSVPLAVVACIAMVIGAGMVAVGTGLLALEMLPGLIIIGMAAVCAGLLVGSIWSGQKIRQICLGRKADGDNAVDEEEQVEMDDLTSSMASLAKLSQGGSDAPEFKSGPDSDLFDSFVGSAQGSDFGPDDSDAELQDDSAPSGSALSAS